MVEVLEKMSEKIQPGICKRCGEIIGKKENFVRLTQYSKGKYFSEGWFHVSCFREGVHGTKRQKELEKRAEKLLDNTETMMSMIGGVN